MRETPWGGAGTGRYEQANGWALMRCVSCVHPCHTPTHLADVHSHRHRRSALARHHLRASTRTLTHTRTRITVTITVTVIINVAYICFA